MNKWPLNINNLTLKDRIEIAFFIFNKNNKWTQDKEVKNFEFLMAKQIGCKFAVFVSSGSTANILISQYIKDKNKNFNKKNIVILPSTTWQTSCSPWIREGYIPHFIDISMKDFSIDQEKLEKYVEKNYKKIACIFPTSLIGFTPDISFYQYLSKKYEVKICFDNCENTLGDFNGKNVSSFFTSSTSTYFGHQLQSVEGGFIFTNCEEEYAYFLMNRNHGMVRSLKMYGLEDNKYKNSQVNELFDFFSLGCNFRNTDINAFIGKLDFKRWQKYKEKRIELYSLFKNLVDNKKFYFCDNRKLCLDVPFCLPIISNENKATKIINICKKLNIEYRPIVSGFLGFQTCYKSFFNDYSKYPNSIYLHNNGIYVGLHSKLEPAKIKNLSFELNKI